MRYISCVIIRCASTIVNSDIKGVVYHINWSRFIVVSTDSVMIILALVDLSSIGLELLITLWLAIICLFLRTPTATAKAGHRSLISNIKGALFMQDSIVYWQLYREPFCWQFHINIFLDHIK